MLIEDCTFDTGDDCIAIKAGRGFDAMMDNGVRSRLGALPPWVGFPTTCSNLVIRGCTMQSGHGGVTLGSEMSGGVDHVFAENIDMLSNTLDIALRFKTNTWRGGFMTNYYARDINVPNGVSASNGVITIDYFYSANASDRPQDAGPQVLELQESKSGDHTEEGGPDADGDVGPQAGRLAGDLPLTADRRPEGHRRQEPDKDVGVDAVMVHAAWASLSEVLS